MSPRPAVLILYGAFGVALLPCGSFGQPQRESGLDRVSDPRAAGTSGAATTGGGLGAGIQPMSRGQAALIRFGTFGMPRVVRAPPRAGGRARIAEARRAAATARATGR